MILEKKNTKSYELITLLEKYKLYKKIKYKLLFMIKYEIFFIYIKIKTKINKNKDNIELFINLIKEYYYLDEILKELYIEDSNLTTILINDNILINIYNIPKHNDIINIEYNMNTKEYTIYFNSNYSTNKKGTNISEKELSNNDINNYFKYTLNKLIKNIENMLISLFTYYSKNNGG